MTRVTIFGDGNMGTAIAGVFTVLDLATLMPEMAARTSAVKMSFVTTPSAMRSRSAVPRQR